LSFNIELAHKVASNISKNTGAEAGLVESFGVVCKFLHQYPERLSWGSAKSKPSVSTNEGLEKLASRFFKNYRKSNFPEAPKTAPDDMVSLVMQVAYAYSAEECERIKVEHQNSMSAENCVGALLERYLDSVLRAKSWHWCCGDFVRAVDFLRLNDQGQWVCLQVKNRDNSENSSSSAIRTGTEITKWFRTFSKTGHTNWHNLPPEMNGYELSEEGFVKFVKTYLRNVNSKQSVKLSKSK
jgi:SinI restriction endonuclease